MVFTSHLHVFPVPELVSGGDLVQPGDPLDQSHAGELNTVMGHKSQI